MLTKKEKDFISQIACDWQTGNHLLYPRTDEYKQMWREVNLAIWKEENVMERTDREKEICEYYKSCFYDGEAF